MPQQNCPCKKSGCPRHGDCRACQAHHAGMRKPSTACERIRAKKQRMKK